MIIASTALPTPLQRARCFRPAHAAPPERAGLRRPRPPSHAAAAAVRGVDAIISWETGTAYFLSCKVPSRGAMDCNDSSLIGGLRCAGRLGAKPPLPHFDEDIILKRIPPRLPSLNFIRIGDCPKSRPGRGLLNNRLGRRPDKTGISQRTTSSCTATTFEGSCRPSSSQRCSALVNAQG